MPKIVKGRVYSADLTLNWIQSMASNEQIADYFSGLSFSDVVVEGDGEVRTLCGKWTGNSQDFDLPEEVSNFREITEET